MTLNIFPLFKSVCFLSDSFLTLFGLGFSEGGSVPVSVPAVYNSKTIKDNEMKFGGVVENH